MPIPQVRCRSHRQYTIPTVGFYVVTTKSTDLQASLQRFLDNAYSGMHLNEIQNLPKKPHTKRLSTLFPVPCSLLYLIIFRSV